jgi:type IV pilus assembly protein PilW
MNTPLNGSSVHGVFVHGFSLIELLIGMTISMIVIGAATSTISSFKKSDNDTTQERSLSDDARFLNEMMGRVIFQAGFQDFSAPNASQANQYREAQAQVTATANASATLGTPTLDLWGYDDTKIDHTVTSFSAPLVQNTGINKSDVLILRYQGVGTPSSPNTPDGSIVDCLGRGIASPQSYQDRAWSILFVDKGEDGQPTLYCKASEAANAVGSTPVFRTEVLAKGVESMQVLYAVDTDKDAGITPDRWMTATDIQTGDTTLWQRVRAVRVGMVIRSDQNTTTLAACQTKNFYPLGFFINNDPGSSLAIPCTDPNTAKMRKVVTFTIALRNPLLAM